MSDQNQNTALTEWHPPQEKLVHNGIVWGGIAAAVVAGAIAIHAVAPTLSDALKDLQTLLANTMSTLITGGVLAVVVILLYQIFSPKGAINKLFAQAYSSFIHNLTLELLNVDPMSPLKDSLEAVKVKIANYNEEFAKFDGAIATFQAREDDLRAQATHAEKQAELAKSEGDLTTFNRLAYEQGSDTETANAIAAQRARLEPVRAIIVRMQSYANDLIYKLGVDIKNTQAQWDIANQMTAMDRAARGITLDGGKNGLAIEAQNIVQTKYATAIGRLENLSDLAKPLLDSADLDKATYSQDLLDKWNAEDAGHATITAQVIPIALPSATPAASSFANLIK